MDRLGALEDATLHAILVRLPLRDAAATVVLSRRWPRVFATLPRLVLFPTTFNRRGFADEGDEDRCEDPTRWMRALRCEDPTRWMRALRCEDPTRWMRALRCVLDRRTAPVAAFEIDCSFLGMYGEWFSRVFRELCGSGGLLELSIANTNYEETEECYAPPPAVYSCTTLTSLDLYNCRLQVPERATLPALVSLRLRNVVASNTHIRVMIVKCTALERLEIQCIHKARHIDIRAPCLKKLDIYSYRPLCISVKKAPPLDMVRLSLSYGYPEDSWSLHDNKDTNREMLDYKKMAEREHEQTDEIKNMEIFLVGLSSTKSLHLHLSTEYSEVVNMAKAPLLSLSKKRKRNMAQASRLMSLPNQKYLLALKSLSLTLDHNHEAIATLVSCLLNSSPNLKDLSIIELQHPGSPMPLLPAEFWEKQITAKGFLYHLSSVTFYADSLLEDHPCGGICKFLVMKARVLKRMSIVYHRSQVKPEHATKLEAARRELRFWPRASADVLLELTPVDRFPWF